MVLCHPNPVDIAVPLTAPVRSLPPGRVPRRRFRSRLCHPLIGILIPAALILDAKRSLFHWIGFSITFQAVGMRSWWIPTLVIPLVSWVVLVGLLLCLRVLPFLKWQIVLQPSPSGTIDNPPVTYSLTRGMLIVVATWAGVYFQRAAECAAFSDLDRWLDACPVELTGETKAGILAMAETTAGAKQRRGTS